MPRSGSPPVSVLTETFRHAQVNIQVVGDDDETDESKAQRCLSNGQPAADLVSVGPVGMFISTAWKGARCVDECGGIC